MKINECTRGACCPARIALAATLMLPAAPDAMAEETGQEVMSEVVVTAQRREQPRFLHAGNIERIGRDALERIGHQHVSEALNRVAGAWIVRGSGQEHQAAIRSPILTGGGACAGYLVLEDGIPIRPAHFCTVNQFTEVNSEQAAAIEVIRGPGNALHGSNAVHGIVNILMPGPGADTRPVLALEGGANDFVRLRAALPLDRPGNWRVAAIYADDGGFRDASGYRQGKLHLKRSGEWRGGDFALGFTATELAQDSAGFIYGRDAYRDPSVNRGNPDPEAFRDASSQRLYGAWSRSLEHFDLDLLPYARHSDMQFMHHGLPGQPVEENGHVSAGLISTATFTSEDRVLVTGLDMEWSDLFLRQTQANPAEGPSRVRATRPIGRHYDYSVEAVTLAPFLQAEYRSGPRLTLGAGLRLEFTQFDYRNHMLAGNTREDGTPCGFGGCLYSRPADRSDRFHNMAPKFSASYRMGGRVVAFAGLARGFRAPQALELYRLQSGQTVADLDSERIDSLELGLRVQHDSWSGEAALFAMRKRDSVFRDSAGFNVSGARSRHHGIEVSFDWQMAPEWSLAIDGSYARHRYDFDYASPRGESFTSGNDMDTAPRWLGGAELRFAPGARLHLGLQWSSIGSYYLDAGNEHRYPGHDLVNLRGSLALGGPYELVLRLNNLADRDYADRADFGRGDYRYLPGRGRELFMEFRYRPSPNPKGE